MFRPDDELTVMSVFRLGSNGRFNKPAIVIFATRASLSTHLSTDDERGYCRQVLIAI